MTDIQIRDLDPRDEPQAISFAIEGMHPVSYTHLTLPTSDLV